MNLLSLSTFTAALQMTAIPESWKRHWPGFDEWNGRSSCVDLDHLEDAISTFDLPAPCSDQLYKSCEAVARNDLLLLLVRWWHCLIYHIDGEIGDNSNVWPMPSAVQDISTRTIGLIAILSGAAHARQNWIDAGVPAGVADASLAFIGIRVREIIQKRGIVGIESMSFLRHAVRGELVRLGRLSFRVSSFPWPFRMFRHRDGRIAVLCDASAQYRRDGLADGSNGIHDPKAWQSPTLKLENSAIIGAGIDETGRVDPANLTLPSDEWTELVKRGDLRIEVHITVGSRLHPAECDDSYRMAMEYFSSRHPQQQLTGFTCMSWLLDPTLQTLLPAESNILRFAKPYRLLCIPGDERQAYDLIYGSPDIDPVDFIATHQSNTLQRAIATHVGAGGKIRAVAGVALWDSAASNFTTRATGN